MTQCFGQRKCAFFRCDNSERERKYIYTHTGFIASQSRAGGQTHGVNSVREWRSEKGAYRFIVVHVNGIDNCVNGQ